MSCKKCGRNNCSCDSGKELAQLENRLTELEKTMDLVNKTSKFLNGHPILFIQQQSDVDQFDHSSGLGEDDWDGWALCNGMQQAMPATGKLMTTPNLLDLFIVGAGDTYQVGDTGGEAMHVLTTPEIPAHVHALTDPGHDHNMEDPGHTHATTQTPHTHGASGGSHSHALDLSTDAVGDHVHNTGFTIIGDNNTGHNFNALNDGTSGSSTGLAGAHSHTISGSTDAATPAVTVSAASISISVDNATTGITETENATTGISMASVGGGEAHENRPPYYAAIYVIKL